MLRKVKIFDPVERRNAFRKLRTPEELQRLIREPALVLLRLAKNPQYNTFSIMKSSGGVRVINAPSEELKRIQKKITYFLNSVYSSIHNPCVNGFVPYIKNLTEKTGIIENAKPHVGQPFVVNMDISDFFPSISSARVRKMFRSAPFNFQEDLASLLALLTCYQKQLPQGAPSSPIITNFIFSQADTELSLLAEQMNLNYTRYADDITFSGFVFPTDNLPEKVQRILTPFGFQLNPKKIRHQSFLGRQEVTGIKVNEKINVDRKYIRRIRAMLHDWDQNGIQIAARSYCERRLKSPAEFIEVVQGKISFVGNVRGLEDAIYLKFREKYEMLKAIEGVK